MPADAYSVVLRWQMRADVRTAGYLLYVRAAGESYGQPIELGYPDLDEEGFLETTIGDLDVAETYAFAVSALGASGIESPRSNERIIRYEDAAHVVDSDHDGLTDSLEDRNLNGRRDGAETDRLAVDTDDDMVPDGLERAAGGDPLDPGSPACRPLDFAEWKLSGTGLSVAYDATVADRVLTTADDGGRSLRRVARYPARGKGHLHTPIVVTRIRSDAPFRVELRVRATDGRRYRLRYESLGRSTARIRGRSMTVALEQAFGAERFAAFGRDLAADLAVIDPSATFDTIERITLGGTFALERPRLCH
jgi:hypothetical protein